MYKYDDATKILINKISELMVIFSEDEEYYSISPYLLYGSEFSDYILKIIKDNDIEKIKEVFDFIEDLLADGDEQLQTLISTTVIESLFFEKNFMDDYDCLKKYFGVQTLNSFSVCIDYQNKLSKEKTI
jgi:aromatic ring-opening dioxygenase LigB subunit